VFVGPPLWEVRQDSPFEHDQHPVRQAEDFAQFRRDKKNRAASVALGDELLVDMFGRADVQPSRRLLAISAGASAKPRATTIFCRLPPDSVPTFTRSLAIGWRSAG
jgi:hypothetical protein